MAAKGPRCSLECIDVEGKPRFLPAGSTAKVCHTCQANLAYWKRQSPARRMLRTSRVQLYARRMEQL